MKEEIVEDIGIKHGKEIEEKLDIGILWDEIDNTEKILEDSDNTKKYGWESSREGNWRRIRF